MATTTVRNTGQVIKILSLDNIIGKEGIIIAMTTVIVATTLVDGGIGKVDTTQGIMGGISVNGYDCQSFKDWQS